VHDARPGGKPRQKVRPREDWIPIAVPAIIDADVFAAAALARQNNTRWSPRRTEPGHWMLRGLVKCGSCGVGTNCHKMRGRNGTWHRYYYCRNHDALRAGGHEHRCPERNIRSGALDDYVFAQVRDALTRPDVLLAGEQAVAVRAPRPDDELVAAELDRLDRKIDATQGERRRLVDLYQAGLLELPELQRRAADVDARSRDLVKRRQALTEEREQLARDNQLRRRVRGFAEHVLAIIDRLDFDQKQNLLRLVVEEVHVTGWNVQIHLRIPLDDPGNAPPDGPPPDPAAPVLSTQDSLRSLGVHERPQLPTQQTARARHARQEGGHHVTINTGQDAGELRERGPEE
jgi:site-specific DNA recombinase